MADREKVINGLEWILNDMEENGHGQIDYYADEIREAITLLKEQEAVVKCKDCKYFSNGDGSTNWLPCREIITPPGWFCADGERGDVE